MTSLWECLLQPQPPSVALVSDKQYGLGMRTFHHLQEILTLYIGMRVGKYKEKYGEGKRISIYTIEQNKSFVQLRGGVSAEPPKIASNVRSEMKKLSPRISPGLGLFLHVIVFVIRLRQSR